MSEALKITFDFKFNRDPALDKKEVKLKSGLIEGCLSGLSGIASASVYPVERMGKSTATVFYVDTYCGSSRRNGSFVAKFDKQAQITEEVDNAARAAADGLVQLSPLYAVKHGSGISALLYTYSRGKELRYWFLDDDEKTKVDWRFIERAIENVFYNTISHAPTCDKKSKPWADEYAWYLNRKGKPVEHLGALCKKGHPLASKAQEVRAEFNRTKLKKLKFQPVCLHGDLHARNIMVDKTSGGVRTSLIDFHWATPGHIFKDYVLLELTMKLALLLEAMNGVIKKSAAGKVDFLDEKVVERHERVFGECWDGPPRKVERWVRDIFPDEKNRAVLEIYEKVVAGVRAVRKAALTNSEGVIDNIDDAKEQYLRALLTVGVGLIGIGDYDTHLLLTSLGCTIEEMNACS